MKIRGSINDKAPAAAGSRGAEADRPRRAARRGLVPPGRPARPGRRPAGPGQPPQRRLSSCSSRTPTRTTRPYGLKSATSWALGVTVPLPIYNRNQGAIQRAVLNVDQTRTELAELERQIAIDIEKAAQEYAVTRREVDELKNEVIPEARQVRDEAYRLYLSGETSIVNYINAQLDFNQVAKQFLDTAIRHRRSMLNLNTVTGRRIMP